MPIETTSLDRWVSRLSKTLAIFAGMVLAGMALLTVISITGRSFVFLGLGPIPGDFELVEMGCAIAVFGFLPYCHLHRGHVTVDILVDRLPKQVFNVLTLIGDFTIAAIAFVVCWRLWYGLQEKIAYGESTMILGAPLWVGYLFSFIGAVWMVFIGAYVLWRDVRYMVNGVRLS